MIGLVGRGLRWARSSIASQRNLRLARWHVDRFPLNPKAPGHSLPGRLTVSLTSYPARFAVLPLTLKSILDQTVRPDRIVLWLYAADATKLTDEIYDLQKYGLEIKSIEENLRSYKKIIPCLETSSEDYIITADDDVYYEPRWIETLVSAFDPNDPAVICRRAHQPARHADGSMAPYQTWVFEKVFAGVPGEDIFATGVGGVLYYPGCFHPTVTNRALFRELCPSADDVWLYWMARMAGARYLQTGGAFEQIVWPGSQSTSLRSENLEGGRNDDQIRAMEARFGIP